MTSTPTHAPVFPQIALCLSGGGYRAAAFHLGNLDMLDELGLMPQVDRLSTVSGGSIIGMTYAVWRIEGKSFAAFYRDFYEFLKTNNVVEQALEDLYDLPSPSGTDDLSLIRAAAEVYQSRLFGGRRFKQLLDVVGAPFKELIFNATEFRIGNSFRFRASADARARIGNNNFIVERAVAEQINLSDIVAASSCFPGGFEPIRFPDDFHWTDLEAVRAALRSGFQDASGKPVAVPLMDGGIYDNQGLSSMLLADNISHPEISLFIISDTSQRDDAILTLPVKPRKGGLSLAKLRWLGWALFGLCFVSGIAVLAQFGRRCQQENLGFFDFLARHPYESLFVYFVPIVLALAVAGMIFWLYRTIRRKQNVVIAGDTFPLWSYVHRLTLPDLLDMAEARASSLMALTGSVFMKRIRQLILQGVMATPERRNRVAFTIIYDMLLSHPSLKRKDPDAEPSAALQSVAERAEKMATTLWFAEEDDLKNLVVCGQATVCFSILRYLLNHHFEEVKDPASPAGALYAKVKNAWLNLKADPNYYLQRTRG